MTKTHGQCKRRATYIRQNAEQILQQLAAGETVNDWATICGCSTETFKKHMRAAVGPKRWFATVKRGARPGKPVKKQRATKTSDVEIRQRLQDFYRPRTQRVFHCSGCGHDGPAEGPCRKCVTGFYQAQEVAVR